MANEPYFIGSKAILVPLNFTDSGINYFYTIEGLDEISECKTFEEVVEYKMPDFGKLDKLNQPLVFRRAV